MKKLQLSEALIGKILNTLNQLPRGQVNVLCVEIENEIRPQLEPQESKKEEPKKK